MYRAWSLGLLSGDACGKYFERLIVAHVGACRGVWRESAHEIMYSLCRLVPVDMACILEYLWRQGGFIDAQRALRYWLDCAVNDCIDSLECQSCTKFHQTVVHRSYILVGRDDDFFAIDYVAGVDLMFEEECGDSGLVIAVDDATS